MFEIAWFLRSFCISAGVTVKVCEQNSRHTAADWQSALLKLSVRRKIMCILIIYILCVKILRMYSVKKQLRVDGNLLFSHPRGLTGQQHCILTAWRTEKKAVWSAFLWICLDLLSFLNAVSASTPPLARWHIREQNCSASEEPLETAGICPETSLHYCKATVKWSVEIFIHVCCFGLINKCISCLFVTGIIKMKSSTVGGRGRGSADIDQKSLFSLCFYGSSGAVSGSWLMSPVRERDQHPAADVSDRNTAGLWLWCGRTVQTAQRENAVSAASRVSHTVRYDEGGREAVGKKKTKKKTQTWLSASSLQTTETTDVCKSL